MYYQAVFQEFLDPYTLRPTSCGPRVGVGKIRITSSKGQRQRKKSLGSQQAGDWEKANRTK
jgi:hypothetical protein